MMTYLKWFCLVTMLLWAVPEVITMAVCPEGDINNDCVVDLYDFAILADQWLEPDGSANIGRQMMPAAAVTGGVRNTRQ